MPLTRLRWLSKSCTRHRWAAGVVAASLPLLGAGCTQDNALVATDPAPFAALIVRGQAPDSQPAAQVQGAQLPAAATQASAPLPISLDTVLRLAEQQNGQVALAREKVNEAFAEKDLANDAWLPHVFAGVGYFRHEGGIQNEDGTLTHSSFGTLFPGIDIDARFDLKSATFARINAQRQVWQQQGELSRITSETVLQAATTYIDLLAARTGEALARQLVADEGDLLDRAQKLAGTQAGAGSGANLQVEALRAEVSGLQQLMRKLHHDGNAASAKLSYLLGLGPCTTLAPVDEKLVPLDLVDASGSCCDLVNKALTNGPGIRELEGLIGLIQCGIEKSKGPGKYVPQFEFHLAEGAFGAGPGSRLAWDNSLDLGVQARWDLTGFASASKRLRVAESKLQQANLTYQDVRAKLAAGVEEAQDAIVSGRDQIALSEEQARHAHEAYRLGSQRLKENVGGTTIQDVMQTVRARQIAQLAYVMSLTSYNKAQLRLFVLLGPNAVSAPSK
jgi:outer membrane protein TolC